MPDEHELSVTVRHPGDRSAGLPGHSFTIGLGVVAEDVGPQMRERLRSKLGEAFGKLYQSRVEVTFDPKLDSVTSKTDPPHAHKDALDS